MKLSALFPESRDVAHVGRLAEKCEAAGLHGMFLGAGFGFDPVMALALAGAHTERILLGTAIVPTWPRHPFVAAQQAATANAICNGRFRFGVGPSHKMVMGMYGIAYDRPIRHIREYVTIVKELLAGGKSSFEGELYKVNGFLDVEGSGQPPILVAALHEQMCRTAGAVADGVLPWLAPPEYVSEHIVPQVAKGAASAGREAPPIIAEVPVILSTDRDHVRQTVKQELGMYLYMPFYTDMLARAGVPGAAESAGTGWTDAMIDAVIPWGDEATLAAAAERYLEAGADEVVFSPFGADEAVLIEALGRIASS